jgi:predicted ATP-grasp superfamily ATP-dependent carboligase
MRTRRPTTRRALGDTSTPIVVFKLARTPLHQGAIGILRSLGRLGVPVHVVRQDRWEPLQLSRYDRGGPLCPTSMDDDEIVERMLAWSAELGHKPIIVPIDDRSMVLVEDRVDELAAHFLFPRRPDGLARRLSDKRELFDICREHGVGTPETIFPQDDDEVRAFADETTYPVVIKRIDYFGRDYRRGGKMAIVESRGELLREFAMMRGDVSPGLMLQEYVPGGPDSVWMFDGYFDASSRCLFGITGQKLRQHPVDTGVATLGICIDNPTVRETASDLLGRLGYTGVVDLGFRYDARDGVYKLLDVNPRVGCTFRLFVDAGGVDVVEALYRDLTGQPVPEAAPVDGRRWAVENYDAVSAVTLLRQGRLTVRDWARSFRDVEEVAWLAGDDLLPFVGMLVSSGAGVVTRTLSSVRHANGDRVSSESPADPVAGRR